MKQITCPHCADTYPDFDVAHVCSKGPYAPRLKPKMNEQIRELAEQATTYIEPTANSGEGWIFDKEKFAELIVRECIEQVRGEFLPVLEDKEMMKDTHWDGYVQCGVDSVVAIREHFFGVAE